MPRGNKILIRTGTGVPTASAFATSEPAWDSAAGELYVKSAAGSMVAVGRDVLSYTSAASFPSTGVAGRVYLDSDASRLYRWESSGSVYVEIAAIGSVVGTLDGGSYGA